MPEEDTRPSRNTVAAHAQPEKHSLIGSDTPTDRAVLTTLFDGWLAEDTLTDLMHGDWPDGKEPFSLS